MHCLVTQLNSSDSHQLHHFVQTEFEAAVFVDYQHHHLGRVLDEIQRRTASLIKLACAGAAAK